MLSLLFLGCSGKIYEQPGVSHLSPEEYQQQLAQHKNAYLLDIRTPMEYKRSHLEGAVNISYLGFSFGKKIAKLDTDHPVFIYCQTAHRSPMAAKKLWKKGFRHIVDLEGGYKAIKK